MSKPLALGIDLGGTGIKLGLVDPDGRLGRTFRFSTPSKSDPREVADLIVAQTEGLLLLTSDGDLAQTLTHPRYKIEKEYEVTLDRPWNPELASKLLRGVFLDGERARVARLHSVSPVRLRVVLRQGINRQIRRMFEAVGYRVKHLIRVRIANLRLGGLPRGHWRPLTKRELESL